MAESDKKPATGEKKADMRVVHGSESQIVWTGPSVRLKNIHDLINSDEMKDDLEAVDRLRQSGLLAS